MTPPPLAEALVRHAVATDAAGSSILGDLRDEYRERAVAHGVVRAQCWYWRQAISMWSWSAWRHPMQSHHYPQGGLLFDVIGDLRQAGRAARQSRGQTLLMIATLGVGIGVTTIGFSFADTVFLRGMPIADPDRTVIVYGVDSRQPDSSRGPVFASDYLDFRERTRTIEQLSAFRQRRSTVKLRGNDPIRVTAGSVTGDLFDVWGLRPHFGRGLRAGDDSPGAGRVVVLADHFWRQMFAAAPEVIGETVFIDGVAHEIVGVMSRDVEFANFADLAMWVPAALPGRADRDLTPLLVTGRLAPSATVENAHAELEIVAREIAAAHPETNRGRRSLVLTARRGLGGPNVVLVMTLLVGTATMVTVIAGVNVAGVLLSRAIVRQREFAMRMALGGRQARLYRQLIVEGLVLAGLGAAVGLLVASAGLRLIHSVDAEPIFQQFVIDWHEVTFVALVAMVSPLVFSLAPALAATRVDLLQTLNAGNARAIGSSRRGREILVTAQLALAVAMVVLGGLVARTAGSMIAAPAGFESANVVTFALALDSDADSAARRATLRQISDGLIKTGAFTTGALEILPATATEAISNVQPDSRIDTPGEAWAHVSHVDEHALTALGVAVVEGRLFTAQDIEGDADVALVSVEAARRYFGGTRDALGRTVTITGGSGPRVHRVIGVTGDVRNTDPERGMPPRVWVPMSDPLNVRFVVRTQGDVQTAAAAIRRVARDVVPGVPVETLETYDQAIARRNGGNRVAMGMLISFAIVALLFAATGLYGTVALSANMRRAEFATRFALGARVVDVAALVVGQAVKLLVIGGTVGFAGGMLAASGMRRLLFGVSPFDPLNLLTVFGLLTLVTLAASLAPAVRAARIDVMQTIRTE